VLPVIGASQRDLLSTNPANLFRGFLSATEQEILLYLRPPKLAGPDALREDWYLAWERSLLVRGFRIQLSAG
jgi:hypothetical protein